MRAGLEWQSMGLAGAVIILISSYLVSCQIHVQWGLLHHTYSGRIFTYLQP